MAYAPADAGEEIRAWLGGREVRRLFFFLELLVENDSGRSLFRLSLCSPRTSFPPPPLLYQQKQRHRHQGNPPLRFSPQLDAPDLGARMRAALNEGLEGPSSSSVAPGPAGAPAAASLVVGSDIPDLQPGDVRAAVDALAAARALAASTPAKADDDSGGKSPDCVLGPAADGGFWVVGARRRMRRRSRGDNGKSDGSHSSLLLPDTLFEVRRLLLFFHLFSYRACSFSEGIYYLSSYARIPNKNIIFFLNSKGITWSTPRVFAAAAASIESGGLELAPKETLRELADIDTVDDLVAWRSRVKESGGPDGSSSESLVSVVDEVLSPPAR